MQVSTPSDSEEEESEDEYSSESEEDDDQMQEEPSVSPVASPKAAQMSVDAAASRVQAAWNGHVARKHVASCVKPSRTLVDGIMQQASEVRGKYEPWVLAKDNRNCKLLHGVPVDLIAYEEELLRLQMRLDGVSTGGDPMIREWRKGAVKQIQMTLDRIDDSRAYWKQRDACKVAAASSDAVQAPVRPVEVA